MRTPGHKRAMELQSQDNPARQVAKAYDDIKEIDYLDISKVRQYQFIFLTREVSSPIPPPG